ncbi:hypothetical protein J3E69DRAFT_249872 [Trichoderma sp. SZMC 28015]
MALNEAFPWLLSHLPFLFAAWLILRKEGRETRAAAGVTSGLHLDFSYKVPMLACIQPSTEYSCSSGTEVLPCPSQLVAASSPCPFLLIPQTCPSNSPEYPPCTPYFNSKASEVLVCTSHAPSANQPYSKQKAVAAAPHQVQI